MIIPRLRTRLAMAAWHGARCNTAVFESDTSRANFHAAQARMWVKQIDNFGNTLPVGYGPFEEGSES